MLESKENWINSIAAITLRRLAQHCVSCYSSLLLLLIILTDNVRVEILRANTIASLVKMLESGESWAATETLATLTQHGLSYIGLACIL
jgi:hypothetical protein